MQRVNFAYYYLAQLPGLLVNTEVYCCAGHGVFKRDRSGNTEGSEPSEAVGKITLCPASPPATKRKRDPQTSGCGSSCYNSLVMMHMVHVRDMWVNVSHRLMFVKMRMRLARRIDWAVDVTMVFIMHMRMSVGHRTMKVLMFMMLSHVQPHPSCH
jgi:hypothetical protein